MGFETDTKLLNVPAKLLKLPVLYYANTKDNRRYSKIPKEASWNLAGDGFAEVGIMDKLNVWCMDGYYFKDRTETADAAMLQGNMIARLRDHGIRTAPGNIGYGAGPQLHDFIGNGAVIRGYTGPRAQGKKTTLVVLANDDIENYAQVKRLADLTYGVQVVCALGGSISYVEKPNNYQAAGFEKRHLSNLAMKFNIKSGGQNHVLSSAELQKFLGKERDSTVIFGADVTHPPTGSLAGYPSIACVVASIDKEFQNYPGSMRLQAGRQEACVSVCHLLAITDMCMLGNRRDGWHGRRKTGSLVQKEQPQHPQGTNSFPNLHPFLPRRHQ
jgi:hypothetical protein